MTDGPRPRRICLVSGSRAEYGLLRPLIQSLEADPRTETRLVVTGAHLATAFGHTVDEIEADGTSIHERVPILTADDSGLGMAQAMGRATSGLAEAFVRQAPDLVVVFGDRYEMLGAASAAMALRLPIAHIAGGQLTEGAVDDAIRHAITKLSHLHFTAVDAYGRRIIQLGEDPDRVFVVGSLGLDAIRRETLLSRAELEARLGMGLGERSLLVTYHPETLAELSAEGQAALLRQALEKLDPQIRLVITLANADAGGRAVNAALQDFAASRPGRAVAVPSLGQRGYLSALSLVSGVLGNSSSALIEAPSYKVGTVNVGDRQKGRIRAASVIDCRLDPAEIQDAVERLMSAEFQTRLKTVVNPFGDGHAADRIRDILATVPLDGLIRKSFRDLP